MIVKQFETTGAARAIFNSCAGPEPATCEEVLEELFLLLEEYGPVWYTEEHRNRIVAALFGARHAAA